MNLAMLISTFSALTVTMVIKKAVVFGKYKTTMDSMRTDSTVMGMLAEFSTTILKAIPDMITARVPLNTFYPSFVANISYRNASVNN